MKDKIIDVVVEKAGIDRAKAEQAVDTVLDYIKENPSDLKELAGIEPGGPALRERVDTVAEKGKEALGEARERVGPMAEKGKEALGDAKEKIAPVAEKVGGRLRGFFKRDDKDEEKAAEPAETTPSGDR
jgi:hypothetical protein